MLIFGKNYIKMYMTNMAQPSLLSAFSPQNPERIYVPRYSLQHSSIAEKKIIQNLIMDQKLVIYSIHITEYYINCKSICLIFSHSVKSDKHSPQHYLCTHTATRWRPLQSWGRALSLNTPAGDAGWGCLGGFPGGRQLVPRAHTPL